MPEPFFTPSPHIEAAALLRGKPVLAKRVFNQLLPELRARAFTIAGVESANVMQRVRDTVATIAEGTTWNDAKAGIISELDPFLGDGADRRAELLLRTHGFQAFQASNWRVAHEDPDVTHLQYLTMEDDRVRPGHAALDGVIVPKNDPFWDRHFPPWEWGCRCRTRTMNPDQVDEAKQSDLDRAPDDRLVMTGPALKKLNEGVIIRNGRTTSILPPEGENAFAWHPENLTLPLDQLEARYDAPVWKEFVAYAKATPLAEGVNLWQWLEGKPLPQSLWNTAVGFSDADEATDWADENMHPDDLNLSKLQRESLVQYQQSSALLNRALQGEFNLSPQLKRQAAAMDRALKKSKAPEALTVYHGSRSNFWSKLAAGDEVDLKSYLSTTLAADMESFKDKAWLKILVPKGAKVLYMDDLDANHADEVEILLGRRQTLKIISVEHRHDATYVTAELQA